MNAQMSLWLRDKWSRGDEDAKQLASAYQATFGTEAGFKVLMHLLNEIYCTVLEPGDENSTNPLALATHNGRRSMVHEILDNIDLAENIGRIETEQERGETNGS